MMKGSGRGELLVLLAVAFLLRLIWVLSVQNELLGDAPWFDMTAKGLLRDGRLHYQGTPTAFFPVGYPAFLSIIYWIAGPNPLAAKIVNAFLSTLICLFTFLTARQILGETVSRISLYLIVFYPSQIFFTSLVITEVLFSTLLIACLYLLTINIAENENWFKLFLSGVFLGLACLVRSIPIFLPIVFLFYLIVVRKSSIVKSMKYTVAFTLGMILVLTPWTIRNALTFNKFVLVSTNGGVNFWMGQTRGRFIEAPDRFTANWLRPSTFPNEEITQEKLAYREAFDFLKQQPWSPVLYFPKKLMKFYYADIDGLLHNSGLPPIFSAREVLPVVDGLEIDAPRPVKLFLFFLSQGYYTILLAGFLCGIYFSLKKRRDPRVYLLLLFIAAWTLFHTLLFFPLGRYRFPIAPLIVIVASYGFASLAEKYRSRRKIAAP